MFASAVEGICVVGHADPRAIARQHDQDTYLFTNLPPNRFLFNIFELAPKAVKQILIRKMITNAIFIFSFLPAYPAEAGLTHRIRAYYFVIYNALIPKNIVSTTRAPHRLIKRLIFVIMLSV